MPSGLRVGSPVLRVRNIDSVLKFYERSLGLHVIKIHQNHDQADGSNGNLVYELGFNQDFLSYESILKLHHDPNAKNTSPHSAGLYHFAIFVPDRRNLASTYIALRDSGVNYDGFADHLVSESLYLRDPENNGIEIYLDRQHNEWLHDSEGQIKMDTLPLDLDSLVSELKEEERKNSRPFPSGARIGHMHLKVTNLERSEKFYREKIGLEITLDWSSMGAAFLSAGGYHHHIGINTWHSLNGGLHSSDETGLENFMVTIPDKSFLNTIDSMTNHNVGWNQQKKQEVPKNQFVIFDPDHIPIVVKSE